MLLSTAGAAMEAPLGVQACNQAPGAGQALCNRSLWLCAHSRREAVPPGGDTQAGVLLWGITESAFHASGVLEQWLEARGNESLFPRAPGELLSVFAPRARTQIAQQS